MLGTLSKGLTKRLDDFEIRGRVETIQTSGLLRSARKSPRDLRMLSCHSASIESEKSQQQQQQQQQQ